MRRHVIFSCGWEFCGAPFASQTRHRDCGHDQIVDSSRYHDDGGSQLLDSHGQSELGFAFCRILFVELLPWLKRMRYERLYLPDRDMMGDFPYLSGVLARPIRRYHAHEHYSDMARHVVAAKERTAPVKSLLRRFNRNNPANQTYKGFLEVGNALKTIHDCNFLTHQSYRNRIHKGRNIVESWNSAVDFICYGGKAEIQTNNPDV